MVVMDQQGYSLVARAYCSEIPRLNSGFESFKGLLTTAAATAALAAGGAEIFSFISRTCQIYFKLIESVTFLVMC